MPILNLLIVLIVIGVILWLIQSYIPMPEPYKRVLIVLITIFVLVWFVQSMGLLGPGLRLR